MKLVIAIIPSHKLEDVIQELDRVKIYRKTVTSVLGVGNPHTEVYRGLVETGNLVKKIRLDIALNDDLLETAIQAVIKGTKDEESDGKIFVLNLADCIQIQSGTRGPDAIGQ